MKKLPFASPSNAFINKKCLGALSSVIQCMAPAYFSNMLRPGDAKPYFFTRLSPAPKASQCFSREAAHALLSPP